MFTEARLYSLEEKGQIIDAIYKAHDDGDLGEASRLRREILPLNPGLAKVVKKLYGKDYLVDNRFNLAEANREFGDGWLDR